MDSLPAANDSCKRESLSSLLPPKRGVVGFAAADVLPDYKGTLIHDLWAEV